jgi:hypothetical protein
VGLVALVALIGIRLPIRTFRDLARGTAGPGTTDHPRLLELERQLPARPPSFDATTSVSWALAQSMLALLLPCWAAHVVFRAGMSRVRRTPAIRALQLALAVGVGLGLSSCTYFLWLVVGGKPDSTFFVADAVVWCLLAACCRAPGAAARAVPAPATPTANRMLRLAIGWSFAMALFIAIAGLVSETLAAPEGRWDARAIWNLRARFLVLSGDEWRQAFAPTFDHIDYPLLVSASIARWWTFLGHDAAWATAGIGSAFTLATVAVVVTLLGARRRWSLGLLAGIVLLGTVRFLRCGAAQYADVPLAFFMLATVALLNLYDEQRNGEQRQANAPLSFGRLLALAGLTAGLAAWTKNEGLLFLAITLAVRAAFAWRQCGFRQALRECGCFLIGAVPPVLVLIVFKYQIPVTNDLIASQGLSTTTRLLWDPLRHLSIWRGGWGGLLQVAQAYLVVIPVCFLLLGRHRAPAGDSRHLRFSAVVVGLMLVGYYAAYLTTPYDLNWHLSTSVDRLLVQLWPIAVLTAFWQMRAPEDVCAAILEKLDARPEHGVSLRKVDSNPPVIPYNQVL